MMGIKMCIGLIFFFLSLSAGLPVCWVFFGTIFVILSLLGTSFSFIANSFFYSLNSSLYMAITFFILAGILMSKAGIAEKILEFSNLIVGKTKGGMLAIGIVASYFLGALTGSSIPIQASLVPLLVDPLEKIYGYERKYTAAVLCVSSPLGYLIPPSLPVLIYCLLAKQSVAAVFLSTIIPGTLLTLGYLVLNYFISDKYRHYAKSEISNNKDLSSNNNISKRKNKIKIIYEALPALSIPLLVLIGIYGGICTPSEAGALAAVYTLFIGLFVYHKLNRKNIFSATQDTIITVGMIFILIAMGIVFGRVIAGIGISQIFAESIVEIFKSKFLILAIIILTLTLLGTVIDATPTMLILVPLLLPVINHINVNLVHFGAIFVVTEAIAVITPPFAIGIFASVRLSKVPYEKLIGPIMWYLCIVAIPVLLLTTFIPALSCWLPTLILGSKIVGSW